MWESKPKQNLYIGMENQQNQQVSDDSINHQEETSTEENTNHTEIDFESLSKEELVKTLKTESFRKNKWKEKFRQELETRQMLEEKINNGKAQSSNQQQDFNEDKFNDFLELREKGYSEPEIIKIFSYSKKMNTPVKEVVEDEDLKVIIENSRKKEKIDKAIPKSTNRASSVNGKSWGQMNEDERRKNFSSFRDNFKRS